MRDVSPLRLFAVLVAAALAVGIGGCLVYLSAADVLVGGARIWLHPTSVATVSHGGEAFEVPLPTASTLEAEAEGYARYLAVGDPRFNESIEPFEYLEQLGSEYLFTSDELRLDITTRKRTSYFTEVELRVSPRARGTGAAPRAQTGRGAADTRRPGEAPG